MHLIYRDVLHDKIGAEAGTNALRQLLRSPPIFPLFIRCALAFCCAFHLCAISFGGSLLDMSISGMCASFLQYLGLNAANKSSMYANVYEYELGRGIRLHLLIPSQNLCHNHRRFCCPWAEYHSAPPVLLQCYFFRRRHRDPSWVHSLLVLPVSSTSEIDQCHAVVSALELMSRNIFCGSVRIVYAIIYTLFLVRELS